MPHEPQNCYANIVTPAWSWFIPGLYHCMQGRIKEAFFWVILVLFLIPFVFPIPIALFLCYRSALRLSTSLQQQKS